MRNGTKLGRIFRELFLIQSREVDGVTALFVLSLLIGIPQIADMTAASTLVVSQLSPDALPWLVLFSGLGSGLLAALFLLIFREKRAKERIVGLTLFLLVGTGAVTTYALLAPPGRIMAIAFYFWSRIENVFLAVVFLVAANARFAPRQSRRLLGFTTTGQVLTLILGGAVIPVLLRFLAAQHLIVASLFAHIVMFFHVLRFPDSRVEFEATESAPQRSLTKWVFVLIAAMYVVYFLIDTAFLGGV